MYSEFPTSVSTTPLVARADYTGVPRTNPLILMGAGMSAPPAPPHAPALALHCRLGRLRSSSAGCSSPVEYPLLYVTGATAKRASKTLTNPVFRLDLTLQMIADVDERAPDAAVRL